jgi:hypothetical protein
MIGDGPGEERLGGRRVGALSDCVIHAVAREHLDGDLGRSLQIIGSFGRHLAVEDQRFRGLGRSPGVCDTSSASFLGTPQESEPSPCVMPGPAFDLRCRGCQATSSITSFLPLNEIASPARLPSNSA